MLGPNGLGCYPVPPAESLWLPVYLPKHFHKMLFASIHSIYVYILDPPSKYIGTEFTFVSVKSMMPKDIKVIYITLWDLKRFLY